MTEKAEAKRKDLWSSNTTGRTEEGSRPEGGRKWQNN